MKASSYQLSIYQLSIAQPVDKYGELTVSAIADQIANNYGYSRAELDEYVMAGKAKAAEAFKNGVMKEAIAPIIKKVEKAEVTVDTDEAVKKSISIDKLMAMPAINCCGTASEGNIAPMADGSGSIIVLSGDKAKELGCKSMAKVAGFGIAAGNPLLIERTTIKSIDKALKYAGISLSDVDFVDLHEPSAAYAKAVSKLLGPASDSKINVDGGSLA